MVSIVRKISVGWNQPRLCERWKGSTLILCTMETSCIQTHPNLVRTGQCWSTQKEADSRTRSSDDATFAYRSESFGMPRNIFALDDRLHGPRPARTAGRKSTTTAVANSKPGQWRSLRLRCTFSMFGNRCVKWNEMEANRYSRDEYGKGDRFISKRCLGWNCRADEQRLRQVVDRECIRSA